MDKISDYSTLLQLAVGLNLVIGAYGLPRKEFEEKVENELRKNREIMRGVIRRGPKEQGPIAGDLQDRPIKELSNRELSRILSDATIRFYRRSYHYNKRDNIIEKTLLPIGFLCVIILVYGSLYPDTEISIWAGIALSVVSLVPPLLSFTRTYLELKQHERFYRREVNENYAKNAGKRHNLRMRSKGKTGEIHRITNQIRTRVRDTP